MIGPILGSLAIPARVEFTTRLMPKMVMIMPTVVAGTLAAGWQLAAKTGTLDSGNPAHGWIVASFIVVAVMAVIALGLLEPANIAVLTELKKERPNPAIVERLMKRFIYTAAVTGCTAGRDARDHDQDRLDLMAEERSLPPVTELGMLTLALLASAVIYLSAHLPQGVDLTPCVVLLVLAYLTFATIYVLLARVEGFAWDRFAYIALRALLAYTVISGMIVYVFVRNETTGDPLVVLILALVLFALDVPTLIAFTVARYPA